MSKDKRFGFGRNWKDFIQYKLTDERIDESRKHMLEFMGPENIAEKSFLDVGCGSGLHSLSALRNGAKSVYAFDYDIHSVEAATFLKDLKCPDDKEWRVEQGSILDEDYVSSLGQYDVVYSWGVLHHTGELWKALEIITRCVRPGGLLYLALYSENAHVSPPPEFWLKVKKKYVDSGAFYRTLMVIWYVWRFGMGRNPLRLPRLLRKIRDYKKSRGMSYMTDVKDWIGGWPMEFSRDEDVIDLYEKKLGFKLIRISTGEANTEYLFKKKSVGSRVIGLV